MKEQKPKRPVLRYHGGKWLLAKWIIAHFPTHRIYTEVYGGGASVLLQKGRCYSEVYNDRWDLVVNVFRVLRDPESAAELERRLRLTPFSRTEFDFCTGEQIAEEPDPIEKARLTIYRSFAGFSSASTNGDYCTGFRANANRSGTVPAHDWVNYPDNISTFTSRLMGVVIENKEATEVLIQHDTPETLHYVDPPYVFETRSKKNTDPKYAFEMANEEHIRLAEVLHSLDGMVVLSGYESDLYNDLFGDWTKIKRDAYADGALKRVEYLWLNPLSAEKQKQLKLF